MTLLDDNDSDNITENNGIDLFNGIDDINGVKTLYKNPMRIMRVFSVLIQNYKTHFMISSQSNIFVQNSKIF